MACAYASTHQRSSGAPAGAQILGAREATGPQEAPTTTSSSVRLRVKVSPALRGKRGARVRRGCECPSHQTPPARLGEGAPLGRILCSRRVGTKAAAHELSIGPRPTIVAIPLRRKEQRGHVRRRRSLSRKAALKWWRVALLPARESRSEHQGTSAGLRLPAGFPPRRVRDH